MIVMDVSPSQEILAVPMVNAMKMKCAKKLAVGISAHLFVRTLFVDLVRSTASFF